MENNLNKIGQITIFIIIAIVIVAGIIIFFVVRNVLEKSEIDSNTDIFDFFDSCIESKTRNAISISGSQGGYIETPEFEPGSTFSPFSSQLDFLGTPIP